MLSLLTEYLVRSRQVFIPHVGTFELKYQPAALDFADRLIHAPACTVVFSEMGSIDKDLIHFLGEALQFPPDSCAEKLTTFGLELRSRLREKSFRWNGFGEISCEDDLVVFTSFEPAALRPVSAHKVIRENAHHGVLVGEKEMSSGDTSYMQESAAARRSYNVIVGWVIALLALCFIIFHLYKNNFHPYAAGLQQKPLTSFFGFQPRI